MTKILIIDYNKEIRSFLTLALQLYYPNVEIIEAKDGQEGLQMAEEYQPDLVFVDGQMPKLSGDIVSERLRNNPHLQGTRIVGYTAVSIHSDLWKKMKTFCDVLLSKTSPVPQIVQACAV